MQRERKTRIIDIALEAGVSTATVDRVLNKRAGVTRKTEERVMHALDTLEARDHPSKPQQPQSYIFDVILPADAGPSTEFLGASMRVAGLEQGVTIHCSYVEKMNPRALAEKLLESADKAHSGVAFQALDHPQVRDAVAQLVANGVPVLALMSDLHGAERIAYVGTDNRAAGRTAGLLMGRFTHTKGKIALLWGGQLYRSHEEREIGFRSILRSDFPQLEVIDLVEGHDDVEANYQQILLMLDRHPDLIGIYNVGGGNQGIVRALTERERHHGIILIGHNLTVTTQRYLLDGSMDAIIHQDMRAAARMAVAALIDHCKQRKVSVERLPVEIILKENLLGRLHHTFSET